MDRTAYHTYEELERRHFWRVGKRRLILEWLDRYHEKPSTGRVLDIGGCCSIISGMLTRYGRVSVVEPEESMIRLARSIYPSEIDFIKGCLPTNLPEGPFDLITLFDVLEHVDDHIAALKAVFARLAPGGTFALTVPAVKFVWSDHDIVLHHRRRYRKREVDELLRSTGFTIVRTSFYTSLIFPLAALARLMSRLWPKRPGRKLVYSVKSPRSIINRPLSFVMSIERSLLRHVNLPIGLGLIAIAQRPPLASDAVVGTPPARRVRESWQLSFGQASRRRA